jgi:malic enzyme
MTETHTMTSTEAQEIIRDMLNTAVRDTASLERRLKELKEDYVKDPHDLTAAQIERVANRFARRVMEAKALAVAVSQFTS